MSDAGPVEIYVLSYAPPGSEIRPIGVLRYDSAVNRLDWFFPNRWDFVDDEFDREYLQSLTSDISVKVGEMGADGMLSHLHDTLSNVLRLSEPVSLPAQDDASLESIYIRFVQAHR